MEVTREKMAEITCDKCGASIPCTEPLVDIHLRTSIERPAPNSYLPNYKNSKYIICICCTVEFAFRYLEDLPIEKALVETANWKKPEGSPFPKEEDVITCGGYGLPHLASVGNCGKDS